MSRRHAIAAVVLGFAGLTFAARDVAAQKVYKWTDKDGKVHFSNVAPANQAAPEDQSGVTGIEAQNPQAPATPAPAAPDVASEEMGREAAPPPAASAESGLSDEGFSARVSATRLRLKRELAQAKAEWSEASDKLAALKKEHDEPTRIGIELLQKAYGPDAHASSDEDDLRKRKEKAERRMEEIRKQYAALHDEAVKRYGHEPGWWLPIE
jgi:hypothetical protein